MYNTFKAIKFPANMVLNKQSVFFAIIILCSFPMLAVAQQKQKPDAATLGDEQISVVKAYQPTLSEAVRINTLPSADTTQYKVSPQTYSIAASQVPTKVVVATIKPIKIKDETIANLYRNYLKLGFGTYTTPYAELYVNSLRSKDFQAGIHAKHISTTGSISDRAYSGYSDNEIGVYGKKFIGTEAYNASVDFNRTVVHYYGFSKNDSAVSNDAIKQRFNYFKLNIGAASNHQNKDLIKHDVQLHFSNLGDIHQATENNLVFDANASKQFSFGDIGLLTNIDYTNNKQQFSAPLDRTIINITPQLAAAKDNYRVTAGILFASEAGHDKGFHVYPKIDASLNVAENFLIAFASINGGLQKTTYKLVTDENPFVNSYLPYKTSNEKLNVTGGVKGTLSNNWMFNVSATYKEIDNMPLFVSDSTNALHNTFTLVYDNVKVVNGHVELGYYQTEKWRMILKGDFNSYTLAHEAKAWYKPGVIVTLANTYNIGDKILLKADIFAHSARYAKTYLPNTEPLKLSGIVDANLGIDYRYSKVLSIFLNFNNIGAVKYQKWENYQLQRFNVMGGLTYSF